MEVTRSGPLRVATHRVATPRRPRGWGSDRNMQPGASLLAASVDLGVAAVGTAGGVDFYGLDGVDVLPVMQESGDGASPLRCRFPFLNSVPPSARSGPQGATSAVAFIEGTHGASCPLPPATVAVPNVMLARLPLPRVQFWLSAWMRLVVVLKSACSRCTCDVRSTRTLASHAK